MRRLDLYWIMALCGLAPAVPFAMGMVMLAKTGTSPTGFFFDALPGAGLGLVAMLGGALVAKTAVTATDAPPALRIGLGVAWSIQFLAMIGTLPIYMLAASYQGAGGVKGQTLLATVEWLVTAGPAGVLTWGLYTAIIVGTEVTVPALLVASAHQSGQSAAVAIAAEKARDGVRTGVAKDQILAELQNGPATAVQLKESSDKQQTTIDAALRDMKNVEKTIDVVPGSRPQVFKLVTETQQQIELVTA